MKWTFPDAPLVEHVRVDAEVMPDDRWLALSASSSLPPDRSRMSERAARITG